MSRLLVAAELAVGCGAIAACGRSVLNPSGAGVVVTSASVALVSTKDTVRAQLTLKNISDTVATVHFSVCTFLDGLSVRAYRAGGPTVPVWDSGLNDLVACDDPELLTLQPGESHLFAQKHSVAQILGDSLPSGSYRFTVSALYFRPSLPAEMGTVTLSLQR
ncbi:MAG TPA: hypothetical protein VGQ30_01785 [Gemmatimonadaceae bacterium]|nr:hypothetical protein [Gemmatimonadaceae bacterium]